MNRLMERVRVWLAVLGPLGAGSRVLLLRLAGRFGWGPVAVGMLVAVYAAFRYRTWIVWMLVGFAAAAWMHAPDEDEQPAVEGAEQAGEQAPEQAPADPFPGMLSDLIGEAPGVHVKSVVEHLHETGLDTRCTPAEVRAGLTRRGIPIRSSVRDAAGRVNQGVHRADLTAWIEARSSTAPVTLAKTRTSAATTAVTSDVADPATGVATPPTAAD